MAGFRGELGALAKSPCWAGKRAVRACPGSCFRPAQHHQSRPAQGRAGRRWGPGHLSAGAAPGETALGGRAGPGRLDRRPTAVKNGAVTKRERSERESGHLASGQKESRRRAEGERKESRRRAEGEQKESGRRAVRKRASERVRLKNNFKIIAVKKGAVRKERSKKERPQGRETAAQKTKRFGFLAQKTKRFGFLVRQFQPAARGPGAGRLA